MTTTFLTEKPAPTEKQLAQIAKLETEARDMRQRSEDSFQRCDTDGFLSQWANDIGARLNDAKVELLRNGGYARFPVLCDAKGNVVASKVFVFRDQFAPDQWNAPVVRKWKLPADLAERLHRTWIPLGGKSRVQKQLGLHEEDRWFPAVAAITTGGRKSTGLSGCANAYVQVFKQGEEE